ncbi:MAG: MMPL family transporter [Ferrimicrobium sp.]
MNKQPHRLDSVGRACARHPFTTIAIWVVVLAAALIGHHEISGIYQNNVNLPGTQSSVGLSLLAKNDPKVSGYTGLIVVTGKDLISQGGALTQAEQNLARLKDVISVSNPLAPNSTGLSKSKTTALITVHLSVLPASLGTSYANSLYGAMEPATHAGLTVNYGGGFDANVNPPTRDATSEAIGFGVAIVVLLVSFGSLVAAGLPLLTAVFSVGIGVSILGMVASVITFATASPTLALMIGLGVGIDYAVFLSTRFRQRIMDGHDPIDAAGRTVATSGHAVLVAATSVSVALFGLYASGITFFGQLGFAAFFGVLTAAAGAITLVPAGLSLAGRSIDRLHLGPAKAEAGDRNDMWHRYARSLQRRPVLFLFAGLILLGVLTIPFFSMRLGNVGDSSYPTSFTSRRAYDEVAQAFGRGANGPLVVVLDIDHYDGSPTTLANDLYQQVSKVPDIASVTPPAPTPNSALLISTVVPKTGPDNQKTTTLYSTLVNTTIPKVTAGTGAQGYVTGGTALQIQFDQTLGSHLILTILAVLVVAFFIIMSAFRSLVLAIKAVVMNLLSIGAAYGVLVATFQWGWGRSLLDVPNKVSIEAYVPLIVFAVVFGLSMDYEVFLLSKVREVWIRADDNTEAVSEGLSSTGRVISAAALIMASVFFAFAGSPDVVIKMFSVGFGVSVLIDATVVRLLLVPSIMTLLGTKSWWIPKWLDKILPHIEAEGVEEDEPTIDATLSAVD